MWYNSWTEWNNTFRLGEVRWIHAIMTIYERKRKNHQFQRRSVVNTPVFNPFYVTCFFLLPLKTWKNSLVSWNFQGGGGYRARPVPWNGLTLYNGGPYYIETSPLICAATQWNGFYMIETSFMKELTCCRPEIMWNIIAIKFWI